jgi:transcriptional regulator with XRE-family HTH domain
LRGDRIRQIRERLGLSQKELAQQCGFGVNQINRYEVGAIDATASNLKILAEKLGVSTDYLLGLSNEERGQLGDTNLNEVESNLLDVFRREGFVGVIHWCTDRVAKSN